MKNQQPRRPGRKAMGGKTKYSKSFYIDLDTVNWLNFLPRAERLKIEREAKERASKYLLYKRLDHGTK